MNKQAMESMIGIYNPNFKMSDTRNSESRYYDEHFKSYMNMLPMKFVEKDGVIYNTLFGLNKKADGLIKLNEE